MYDFNKRNFNEKRQSRSIVSDLKKKIWTWKLPSVSWRNPYSITMVKSATASWICPQWLIYIFHFTAEESPLIETLAPENKVIPSIIRRISCHVCSLIKIILHEAILNFYFLSWTLQLQDCIPLENAAPW